MVAINLAFSQKNIGNNHHPNRRTPSFFEGWPWPTNQRSIDARDGLAISNGSIDFQVPPRSQNPETRQKTEQAPTVWDLLNLGHNCRLLYQHLTLKGLVSPPLDSLMCKKQPAQLKNSLLWFLPTCLDSCFELCKRKKGDTTSLYTMNRLGKGSFNAT